MRQYYRFFISAGLGLLFLSHGLWADDHQGATTKEPTEKEMTKPVVAAPSQEIEGVSFSGQMQSGETGLNLNGVGLRRVTRFGIPIRVYVAGLYLEKPEEDSDKILESADKKILHMQFLRRVDAGSLRDAWQDGVFRNCRKECDSYRPKLNEFNSLMVEMREGSTMTLQFLADAVEVEIKGRQNRSGRIEGEAFRENLLAAFIGARPPSEDFKSGLLGK